MNSIDFNVGQKAQLLNSSSGFISENKRKIFDKNIENRTRYITALPEDIFQIYNTNALLRTCDCFWGQDVHIVENKYNYQVNPGIGFIKRFNLYHYNNQENNAIEVLEHFKRKGYKVIATMSHDNDQLPGDLQIYKKQP
ncbi:MAG: hypothetical protein JW731_13245 [Bacteroidales bacterium]|nr:hypothetical protein [Bacteroidales bacterium]